MILWAFFSLFPAHAGVILPIHIKAIIELAFPRTRGGDPHARDAQAVQLSLFPAHAGVIPAYRELLKSAGAFPRTRGGDPYTILAGHTRWNFSPHTRG